MGVTGYQVENSGMWPVIMAEMTLLCLANPDSPMRMFMLPCEIKAKYYPFVLFGLFVLMNGFRIQFDVLSGILFGLLHHFVIKNKLQLTESCISRLEGCVPFK